MNGERKIKAVLDTNIYISAFFWFGYPHTAVEAAAEREIVVFISPEMLDELERVFRRDFLEEEDVIKEHIIFVRSIADIVYPKGGAAVVKEDPDDDKIIACAQEAKAEYIVTGDQHLLKLGVVGWIKIVTASEFIRLLRS